MQFLDVPALPAHDVWPGFRARFVHSPQVTLAFWETDAGATVPTHSHPQEQIVIMQEGTFELTVAGEPRVMRPGEIAVVPGGVEHSARAITPCRLLDVFHPIRDDYRQRFG